MLSIAVVVATKFDTILSMILNKIIQIKHLSGGTQKNAFSIPWSIVPDVIKIDIFICGLHQQIKKNCTKCSHQSIRCIGILFDHVTDDEKKVTYCEMLGMIKTCQNEYEEAISYY